MSTSCQRYSDMFDAEPPSLNIGEDLGCFDEAIDELSSAGDGFPQDSRLGCDVEELDRLFAEEDDALLAEGAGHVANHEALSPMLECDSIRQELPAEQVRRVGGDGLGALSPAEVKSLPLPQADRFCPKRCAKRPAKQVRRKSASSAKQAKMSAGKFRRRSANDVDKITRGNGNPHPTEQILDPSMLRHSEALTKLTESMRRTALSRRNLLLQRALLAQQQTDARARRMAAFFSGSRGTLTDELEQSRRQLTIYFDQMCAMYFGRVGGQM